jgi:hypothetical protein
VPAGAGGIPFEIANEDAAGPSDEPSRGEVEYVGTGADGVVGGGEVVADGRREGEQAAGLVATASMVETSQGAELRRLQLIAHGCDGDGRVGPAAGRLV